MTLQYHSLIIVSVEKASLEILYCSMQKEKSMAQFEPEEIGKAIKVLAKSLF